MLLELRVENLLLIERAELRLGPGLTVLTGETGAGKTVLAHALDLLLGGRPRGGSVRPGAAEAYVEGVFAVPDGLWDDPALAGLRERVPDGGEGEVVLGRRVGAEGRTRAWVQHRSASAGDLGELGRRLMAFYGQHEHRRLTVASAQRGILDAFAGAEVLLERFADAHAGVQALRREREELRARAAGRHRDLDLLRFELEEIQALGPSAEEERALRAERARLRSLDDLRIAAGAAAEALVPEEPGAEGAVARLAGAQTLAEAVEGADPALDALAERLRGLALEAEDLGHELRAYGAALEGEPGRLDQVEERLAAYERLARKHGGGVGAMLEHAERCRREAERLEGAEEALEGLVARLEAQGAEEDRAAGALSTARARAAPRLAALVRDELAQLALGGAEFSVELEPLGARSPAGDERVEFMLAPNPGVPAAPLRETASGGELSRAMLALMGVASGGGPPTLVFDEVDAGVGGQTARAVGRRLRSLARSRQVLCITHLPLVAAQADHHFRIEKTATGRLARTEVERLEPTRVVDELCRMLGADAADLGARRHAEGLLAAA